MMNNSKRPIISVNERLLKAADCGDFEGVKKAIEDGASLDYNLGNNPAGHNKNPLFLAVQAGREEIARYLLDNVEIIDAVEYSHTGSLGKKLFESAKTNEIKVLIAEKADISLFRTIQGTLDEKLAHTVKAMLKQYRQVFAVLDSKIESQSTQIIDIKNLLEAENSAIKQMQVKDDLIAQQNDIIKQLSEELMQQKAAIAELQLKFDDNSLSIEVNEHERQLQELKQEIASLKSKLNKGRFKDKAQKIATIQALSRGFLSRKRHSLTSLKEYRKAEIQAKLPEAMAKFAAEGKYDDMAKLVDAMKHENLHQAMQIVRGKPEQEVAIGNKVIKY